MGKQKKWWWVSANTHSTNTKHRSSSPVVSPIVACSGSGASNSTTSNPSTRASFGSKHQVVLSGIDTLAVTAGGASAPSSWLVEQQPIWLEYQNQFDYTQEYLCIELDGRWWQLYPVGSNPYKYQLRNDEVGFIKIWNVDKWGGGVMGKQHIHIHFYSKYLHQFDTKSLFDEVMRITSKFFDTDTYEVNVSRADLHTDVTNGSTFLSTKQIENVISRSKVRQHYYEDTELVLSDAELDGMDGLDLPLTNNKGEQKLIDVSVLSKLMRMYHQQTNQGANSIITKREIETAYFGKKSSSIWGKFYNKTKEVVTKNDDDTPLLWSNNGWNGNDVVVRVEFSMRRDFIKQLDLGKYVSLQSFLQNVDTIWKYLTEKWLRMVDEVKDNNSTWSKVSTFWEYVTKAFVTTTQNVIRKKLYRGKVTQLWKQGVGCIKQMISVGMVNNEDWCYVKSTIQALENTLSSSIEDGEYYSRRQLLGVA